jgi:hypothetical protein
LRKLFRLLYLIVALQKPCSAYVFYKERNLVKSQFSLI